MNTWFRSIGMALVKAILTHPGYVGIRLYGSGPGAQKKLNALARKQKRGKVKSRLRVKPHFFGVFPEDAIFQSEEEQTLFWEVQKRYNPVDLRHLLDTNYKEERPNPVVAQPRAGRPGMAAV